MQSWAWLPQLAHITEQDGGCKVALNLRLFACAHVPHAADQSHQSSGLLLWFGVNQGRNSLLVFSKPFRSEIR